MPLITLGEFEKQYPQAVVIPAQPEHVATPQQANDPNQAGENAETAEPQIHTANAATMSPDVRFTPEPATQDEVANHERRVSSRSSRRIALAGAGVGILALGWIVGPQIGGDHNVAADPGVESPVKQPAKNKSKSGNNDNPVKANPETSQAPLANAESITKPEAWNDCTKPIVNLSIAATGSVYVPVKLRTGQVAPLKFRPEKGQAPLSPQTTYYGSAAVAACVNNQSAETLFDVQGKQVSVDRASFITHGLFPAVNTPNSPNKETVQGMDPKYKLVSNKQISKNQADKVNNWMLPTGTNHDAYSKTVDWLLRGQILNETTGKQGANISELIDKYFKDQLDAANKGEGFQFSFTGSYPSLNAAYDVETALFKPISQIKLVDTTVVPLIIKTKSQTAA